MKNKGFTLLLSLLVISVILSVGLGVSNIMIKELKLSGPWAGNRKSLLRRRRRL